MFCAAPKENLYAKCLSPLALPCLQEGISNGNYAISQSTGHLGVDGLPTLRFEVPAVRPKVSEGITLTSSHPISFREFGSAIISGSPGWGRTDSRFALASPSFQFPPLEITI